MFAQAISSTMPVTAEQEDERRPRLAVTSSSARGRPASTTSGFALNRAIVWSLMPFCSGASTSLMIGR